MKKETHVKKAQLICDCFYRRDLPMLGENPAQLWNKLDENRQKICLDLVNKLEQIK